MTLDAILQNIHAMKEDVLVFERKYNVPTEVFYEAYQRGEEPADSAWVLDWSQWAGSYEILQEQLTLYQEMVQQLLTNHVINDYAQLIERTARHEPVAVAV